jgi:MFS-type transporter involved in bile tolerance (Atg22 family)
MEVNMPTLAEMQEARRQFWTGVAVVTITAIVQMATLFSNANYTLEAFGKLLLIIYLAAAACYIMLPWVEDYLEEHTHVIRYVLLAFCAWIGTEEFLHQAHAFQAPDGAMALATLFMERDHARSLVITVIAIVGVIMVEVLWHIHSKGAKLVRGNLHAVRKPKSSKRPSRP